LFQKALGSIGKLASPHLTSLQHPFHFPQTHDRAGIVGFAAFDKTGTLTEERLHFKGVTVPQHLSEVNDQNFFFSDSARGASPGSVEFHSERTDIPTPCIELMATCHALALIDGVAVGDPLEVEMFRASGFSMASNGNAVMSVHSPGPPLPSTQYDVLRHFEFTSDRARAGSLIKRPNRDLVYYSKGSPEAILKLVDQSTVPSDIHSTLTTLSKRGLRVLAMSYKVISKGDGDGDATEITKFSQSELEESSIFLGLIFLSNALKAETLSTINALRGADIKCNMITGDHIHTAIAIATDCGLLHDDQDVFIIDATTDSVSGLTVSIATTGEFVTTNITEFLNTKPSPHHQQQHHHHHHTQIAITGVALEVVKSRHTHMMKLLLESVQVFARMKPSDKQFIVEQLQHLTENDAKEMFADEDRSSISNDPIQISSDLPHPKHQSFRKSMLDDVAVMMDDDGRGDLHVIFCGDGKNYSLLPPILPPSLPHFILTSL
jgi:magnesium-transporting ATPase (P-type)